MLSDSRIALNRIICPRLTLEEFFKLCAGLGLSGVELRNDLPGGRIIDDYSPARARALGEQYGIKILTINALQQFNLGPLLGEKTEEAKQLADLSRAVGCEAVVLCPNNDTQDARDAERMYADTVRALQVFGPVFEQSGVAGYVEPLGFSQSSLASAVKTREAIRASGFSCYQIVFDTFHHFLGPDTPELLEAGFDVRLIGIVHASGTTADPPAGGYLDEHRGLVFPDDRLKSREQIHFLLAHGYEGPVAFEPFSAQVQDLALDELTSELKRSIDYLKGNV
jgi:2-keto-myo-inositol isomerase